MGLRQLRIRDFKSYTGEYLIGPLDRFTSIIGPNGSGKSNILDAVIFVLNVPVASMRARSLDELISHGRTEASVEVLLSDSTFERRIIRREGSTQSVYLYDGGRVSQKEYVAKLEALNIMSRVKNFIICQGDVMKADINLLQMMEGICGSDSLAEEYEEAEKKLVAINKNLSVVFEKRKDLLACVEAKKLSKAKEVAYRKLAEEREWLQEYMAQLEMDEKGRQLGRLEDELRVLSASKESPEYSAKARRVEELRMAAAAIQKEYFEKESELIYEKTRNTGHKTNRFVAAQREEANLMEAEIKHISEKAVGKCRAIASLTGPSVDFPTDFAHLKSAIESLYLRTNKLSSALSEKELQFNRDVSQEEGLLSEALLNNFEKINQKDDLSSRIKSLTNKTSRFRQDRRIAEHAEHDRQNKIAELTREREALFRKIEDRSELYDRIVADEQKKNKELSSVMGDILMHKAHKSDLVRKSATSAIIANLKCIFSGVHGKAIDLIKPTQKKYELSIGVLLSSLDMAVIVDNERVALDCIRYIKEQKACKLTFLPLSRIKSHKSTDDNSAEAIKNTHSLSRNCISYNQKYSSVVDFIFGDSLIVESAEQARRILYEEHFPHKVCSIDGSLFSPSGIITGGREAQNKFDSNMVDELLARRTAILNDLKVLKDRREAYADVQNVKNKMASIDEHLQSLVRSRRDVPAEEDLRQMEGELARLSAELTPVERDLQDFEQLKKAVNESKKRKEILHFSSILGELGLSSLSDYRAVSKDTAEAYELLKKVENLTAELNGLREEIQSMETDMGRLDNASRTANPQLIEQELDELNRRLEAHKASLKDESLQLKRLSEIRAELDRRIMETELLKARLEEDVKDMECYAIPACNNTENTDDSLRRTEFISRLSPLSPEALSELLKQTSRQLQENASVSLGEDSFSAKFEAADREYRNLRSVAMGVKKHFFEIKALRTERFRQCFNIVSEEVSSIYRILSKHNGMEGSAYIVYEGDPFSNNLKYYLMPPLKRFTEFENLSGGERSIALLSFIFALNKYRPAPLYILDEVDAALDRHNMEKLASYILASSDQFLVVTLKHKVFQYSDALIGVYKCPNENRSKILSYRPG